MPSCDRPSSLARSLAILGLLCMPALADDFQLNSYTPNNQSLSGVAMMPSGDFVAVWSGLSAGSDQSSSSVQARRFLANGVPLGPDFQVNTHTTDYQAEPSVAMDAP